MSLSDDPRPSAVVVGGGLTGLTAALELARAGRRPILFECASRLGGRALTEDVHGFRFNLGPHALYARGAARRILDELGVAWEGHPPPTAGLFTLLGDDLRPLPAGLLSLLRAPGFDLAAKWELMTAFAAVPKLDPAPWRGRPLSDWLAARFRRPASRRFFEALARLTTYGHAPELFDAAVVLEQLRLAFTGNVLYLDGGWQTLVDGLREAALAAGARIETGHKVTAVLEDGGTARGVALDDGTEIPASAVILAVSPAAAARLVASPRGESLRQFAASARPMAAACLDVGLERLPDPAVNFVLGLDRPLYYSVHTAVAELAPPGGALIHVARYLHPDESPSREEVEAELEGLLDRSQPGWRDALVERRLMPRMMVSPAMPTARTPWPDTEVVGIGGLWLAGDWVGSEGLLADAAVASGRRAARAIVERRERLELAA